MPFWNDLMGGMGQAAAGVVTGVDQGAGTITVSNSQEQMNQLTNQPLNQDSAQYALSGAGFGNLRHRTVLSDPFSGPVNFEIPIQQISHQAFQSYYNPPVRDIFTVVEEMVTAWMESGLVIEEFVVPELTYSRLQQEHGHRMIAYAEPQFIVTGEVLEMQKPSEDLFIHTPYGSVKIVQAGMNKINWDQYMEDKETNLP